MVAYPPKATVQAAIGAIPLTMGLLCGQIVLTVAVLSILITAPFGAICMDNLYQKQLVDQITYLEGIPETALPNKGQIVAEAKEKREEQKAMQNLMQGIPQEGVVPGEMPPM